ncbi:hypothetical protein O181_042841 [Austropuccinia psidii MF-1]|uniref:Reverse transcriptase RNase H-like domain-containing protein n=1 Tax=Austropuccinia psidii MF-1 TaxID=1389203 RepID=A0A9Q3HFG8_9BASI|nr:hypothetical protein [Austropuccinia psidii MF-1]
MSSKVLTRRQACLGKFLPEFHFSITYRPGRLATLPEALSRWGNVYPERGEDFISKNPMNLQQLIKQNEKNFWQDSQYRSILQELRKGKSVQDYSLHSSSQLLFFKDWVVVPNDPTIQLSILRNHYDSPLAGHPGQEKTLKLVKRDFHCSNPSLPTIVETDASNYALGAVLSQVSDSGKHPIAFDSHKSIPTELYYEIHDKELLGIVWALKCWRAFLLSLSSPFEVLTDHSSLQYFMSAKFLTRRQAHCYSSRGLITLGQRLSGEGEDFISKNTMDFQQLIQQDEVQSSRYFAVKVESFPNLIESIQKRLWQDSHYRSMLQELGKGKSAQDYSLASSSQLLLFKDLVVVLNDPTIQLSIFQKSHDSPLAGHPGQEKTLKLVKGDFDWSRMTQFIKDHVSSHQQCSRNKNTQHKKFGLLKPLPIPNDPWICLSMDFITQFPLSNSFDSILVIVDRFS